MISLTPNLTPGAAAEQLAENHWRLSIPAGSAGKYRLAQIDDYTGLWRDDFPWQPPLRMQLQCRASSADLPGTWGFGLWNDPFSLSMGFGGGVRRLPALPNALYDDQPGSGQLAMSMYSPRLPASLLALGVPFLPLLAWRMTARWLRSLGRRVIRQASTLMLHDPTTWHSHRLEWMAERARLWVDESLVLDTNCVPQGPLGLVLWLDNQYAALPPDGRLKYGTLENLASWIEIKDLEIG
jgi:hypothetical protein